MNTVLVVDDDRMITALMAAWLDKLGCALVSSFDVLGAIKVLQSQPIGAVILDLEMPGGNGSEVIRQMKSTLRTGSIPIIVVSANDDPGVITSAILSGADLFLAKPTDFNQIREALGRVFPNEPFAHTLDSRESYKPLDDIRLKDNSDPRMPTRGHWVL